MVTKHISRLFSSKPSNPSLLSPMGDSIDLQPICSCVAPAACFIQQKLISLLNQARGDAHSKTSSKSQTNMRNL
jgi:hypothetical protein